MPVYCAVAVLWLCCAVAVLWLCCGCGCGRFHLGRPLTVGLWFSLGHCTVVLVMCTAVAAGSSYIRDHLGNAESIGAIIGTAVSASMLFLIGFINL